MIGLGRSSGGLHMALRGFGCPLRFIFTPGREGDAPKAETLIALCLPTSR